MDLFKKSIWPTWHAPITYKACPLGAPGRDLLFLYNWSSGLYKHLIMQYRGSLKGRWKSILIEMWNKAAYIENTDCQDRTVGCYRTDLYILDIKFHLCFLDYLVWYRDISDNCCTWSSNIIATWFKLLVILSGSQRHIYC